MKTYKIYFELFGKKMQTNINADNENEVKENIKNKIIFHKILEVPESDEDIFRKLKDIFSGNGMKI